MPCHVRKPPMVKKKICQSVNYVPTLKVDILELQPNYTLTPNHSRNTLAHILYPLGNSDYVKILNRNKSWNSITSCTRMNTADITGEDPKNWDARSIRVFIHWLLAILGWNLKALHREYFVHEMIMNEENLGRIANLRSTPNCQFLKVFLTCVWFP